VEVFRSLFGILYLSQIVQPLGTQLTLQKKVQVKGQNKVPEVLEQNINRKEKNRTRTI
jgi:hypothetical protein